MFSRDEFIYLGRVEARPGDSRYRLAQLVGNASAVLDVGCAVGYLGEFLRRSTPQRWLAGIEMDPRAAEQAKPYYDQLVVGSIEDEESWNQLGQGFGAMIFGDVLEHTRDPIDVLHMARRRLSQDGLIVISLPNIAYFKVRYRLLRGIFEYEESGIMDRTHLRFFTSKTAQEMLRHAGFRVIHLEGISGYPPAATSSRLVRLRFAVRSRLRSWLTQLWPGLFAYQFILVARQDQARSKPESVQPDVARATRDGDRER